MRYVGTNSFRVVDMALQKKRIIMNLIPRSGYGSIPINGVYDYRSGDKMAAWPNTENVLPGSVKFSPIHKTSKKSLITEIFL